LIQTSIGASAILRAEALLNAEQFRVDANIIEINSKYFCYSYREYRKVRETVRLKGRKYLFYARSGYLPLAAPAPDHSVISGILKISDPGYHHTKSSFALFQSRHHTLNQDNAIPPHSFRRQPAPYPVPRVPTANYLHGIQL
jgi:hypothetical protein